MQKITPFLWLENRAEEAMLFYTSMFKNSKAGKITRYGEGGPMPKGTVLTASFQIEGQEFVALNGTPAFKFNESVSFSVACRSQEEIDELWEKLSAGGEKGQCGWLKDKFGLSWQVVPSELPELLGGKDAEGSQRVFAALLQMRKLDIKKLRQAFAG